MVIMYHTQQPDELPKFEYYSSMVTNNSYAEYLTNEGVDMSNAYNCFNDVESLMKKYSDVNSPFPNTFGSNIPNTSQLFNGDDHPLTQWNDSSANTFTRRKDMTKKQSQKRQAKKTKSSSTKARRTTDINGCARGREPMAVENIVMISPDATLYETTGLYHDELGSINIKDIKGVYKNCRGIWAAQWTDAIGQRHTKYFNPKYFTSEESARVNAYKFKLDVTLQMERAKAGTDGIQSDYHRKAVPLEKLPVYPVKANSMPIMYPKNGYPTDLNGYTNQFPDMMATHSRPSSYYHPEQPPIENYDPDLSQSLPWAHNPSVYSLFSDSTMSMPLEPPKIEVPSTDDSINIARGYQPDTNNMTETNQIITYAVLIASVLGFCPCRTCACNLLPPDIDPPMASQILKWTIDARMTNTTASLTTTPYEILPSETKCETDPQLSTASGQVDHNIELSEEVPRVKFEEDACEQNEPTESQATAKVEINDNPYCIPHIGSTLSMAMGFDPVHKFNGNGLERVSTPITPMSLPQCASSISTTDNTPSSITIDKIH